jgi:hypothetical protein
MKRIILVTALLAMVGFDTHATPPATNSASRDRTLFIDPSSMSVSAGGTATLTIGVLKRTNGIYSGEYKMEVSPYFFKNEKGKLAIVASDESLAKVSQGKVTEIIGTATGGGETRRIEATATPASSNHGKLKLWFTAGGRKMVFEPTYRFIETAGEGTVQPPAAPRDTAISPPAPARKLDATKHP